MCPQFWQREFINWFNDQDVEDILPDNEGVIDVEFQEELSEKVEHVRTKLAYTGACKTTTHCWGPISFFPKASWFIVNADWSVVNLL